MYRIVCESYENYMRDFANNNNDFRYKIMLPFRLLLDKNLYEREREKNSLEYRKLNDFIWNVKEDIIKYPQFKSFLWSLESRAVNGFNYGILSEEEYIEQIKIINMFLKLSYWN